MLVHFEEKTFWIYVGYATNDTNKKNNEDDDLINEQNN